jgi:hypothetical protein
VSENFTQAHARFAPSSAEKFMECSGSVTLELGLPDTPTEYSDNGTACHAVAAWCLTEHRRAAQRINDWIVVSGPNETPERKIPFTADMADKTQQYVDTIRKMAIGHELMVEERLPFSKFVATENQFGTRDAGFVDWENAELVVADAKFGHIPVPVKRNKQLMTYAVATIGHLYEQAMAAAAPKEEDDDFSA